MRRRALLNVAALLAFIAGIVAAQQAWARPTETTVLFLPVVRRMGQPTPDSGKGIAGFTFAPNVTTSLAYRQMGIGSELHWQTMYTPTWNASLGAYPLASQPLNFFRSLPSEVWFSLSQNGMNCGSQSQAELAACAADAVRGQGSIYVIYGNEPDNGYQSAGDALTPTLAAMDFHSVRDTLRLANSSVLFVYGNYLWPNAGYFNSVRAEFHRLYGEDIRASIAVYGWHAYSNVNNTVCYNPYSVADGACVAQSFANEINNITKTLQVIDPGKPWWLTEWGVDSQSLTDVSTTAVLLPLICTQAKNSGAARRFLYIGVWTSDAAGNALIDAGGNLTDAGRAYAQC